MCDGRGHEPIAQMPQSRESKCAEPTTTKLWAVTLDGAMASGRAVHVGGAGGFVGIVELLVARQRSRVRTYRIFQQRAYDTPSPAGIGC